MKNEDERPRQKDSLCKAITQKSAGVCRAEKNDRRLLRGHVTQLIK
ncbi:hypothetical protein E4O04_09760 [Treponema sp. OMZ 799]|nr:hypothetical protein [Treponema sp. OMZ 799]UTC77089.1 hypothetical protein E4O04_03330 [Treponema sp. OMZ 799]UTC78274.1 hypothetical protein E4O04_09760 [Treponema sp. OMZ 799]